MDVVPTNADPRSPQWWLQRLTKKLNERNRAIKTFNDYYRGDHNLAFATPKFRETFGRLFSEFSDNWCKLIVDAPDERLSVEGFRYGDDTQGDKRAWAMWQANSLDALSSMAHVEALIHGESYAIVWSGADGEPFISIEHPSECIVDFAPSSTRRRTAALKWWREDDGFMLATLYLPDALYKFQSTKTIDPTGYLGELRWTAREVADETWPVVNPWGVVPVVPLMNDPRLLDGGVSEIADAIPVQDAVNKVISDMMVTSEFHAAPQRYVLGLDVKKDETGKPMQPMLEGLANRLWVAPKNTELGQFPQADLSGYREMAELFVQHLASRTRTPPHYFYLSGNFPSGESIKSAETGLVAKVRRKQKHFGEAWEEVMRLAFLIKGDKKRSQDRASETVWRDPETRSESEHIDAIGKQRALLNIPLETAWERAGYSPEEISRMKTQLADEKNWLPEVEVGNSATEATQIAAGAAPPA